MARFLVACDAGHGMQTAGKRTDALKADLMYNGKLRKKGSVIHENELNRTIMDLFMQGCKRCGIDTVDVAPGTEDQPLKDRVTKANSSKANLYVSFHANALTGKWQERAYGLVVIKHEKSSKTTDILAQNIYKELSTGVKWYSNGATKYGVRKDTNISGHSLYVLKNTSMPAVLVEYGFMDNWEDVKVMVTEQFVRDCAERTLKGVCDTLGVVYVAPSGASKPVQPTSKPANTSSVATSVKYVRVKVDSLNVRKTPSWDDSAVHSTVKKGSVYTVVEKVKVGSAYMYKLKSGLYITASTKYIDELTSI